MYFGILELFLLFVQALPAIVLGRIHVTKRFSVCGIPARALGITLLVIIAAMTALIVLHLSDPALGNPTAREVWREGALRSVLSSVVLAFIFIFLFREPRRQVEEASE